MEMTGRVEVPVVVCSQYSTLKLFWKTLESDVVKVACFTSWDKQFTRIL